MVFLLEYPTNILLNTSIFIQREFPLPPPSRAGCRQFPVFRKEDMDSFFFYSSLCPYLILAWFYPSRIKGLGKEGEKRRAGKFFLGWDSWHLSRTGKCIKSALSLLLSRILGQPSCWAFNIGKCHSFAHLFPIQTWLS